MRKLVCLFSLLAATGFAMADACNDVNQVIDEIVPKVSTGLDKASQATNLDELSQL
jgi:hypothetical protein